MNGFRPSSLDGAGRRRRIGFSAGLGLWLMAGVPLGTNAASTPLPGRLNALFAGNASSVDNAEPEPVGQLDAEFDLTYARNHDVDYAEWPLTLTYGLMPRWDASVAAGGVWESYPLDEGGRHTAFGFGDIFLNSKFKVLDQEQYWATQSIELGIKVPTASRGQGLGTGRPDYDLTWLVTKDVTDRLAADVNFGYTWVGDGPAEPLSNQFHYGIALEYQATRRLSLVGQLFAATPTDQWHRIEGAATVAVGWRLTSRCSAHASFTKGLGSVIGVIGTVGITWTFGPASPSPKPPHSN